MVCSPSSLLTATALAAVLAPHYADATSMKVNPITPGDLCIGPEAPMWGREPSPKMVQPIIQQDPTISRAEVYAEISTNNSTDQNDPKQQDFKHHRNLEVTSPDVQRLEQYFGTTMETNVNTLFTKYGSSQIQPAPWPSSYWPTYEDSINHRWGSDVSPSEKYAKAFGLNVKQFQDKVSSNLGIDTQASKGRTCTSDSQCTRYNDGSACAKREGKTSGYCVPTWWGICHAWAPAAILEDEPKCDVVKNGVTFHPFDIKALMTVIYDGANTPTVFTGARYNGAGSPRDEYGRFTDAAERDLGPGFFHIAVLNIMGRFGKSFVVDVNADAQVWNQPVRSYTTSQPKIMTPNDAAQQFFKVPKYPFNNAAVSIAYVEMDFSYINEYIQDGPLVSTGIVDRATATRHYKYCLELDANQNVIGGEWVGDSQTDHPDFLWFATSKPASNVVTDVGLSYSYVSDLLKQSVSCGTSAPATTTSAPVTTTPAPVTTTPAPVTTMPTTPTTSTPTGPSSGKNCGNFLTGQRACPVGEYCYAANLWGYECRRLDQCGKQEVGIDFYGDDIDYYRTNSPDQCCDKCQKTRGCKAYTFVANLFGKGDCYLKSGAGQRTRLANAISAVIVRN